MIKYIQKNKKQNKLKKKSISILFRTAGGKTKTKELGLGHIFRCINLAKKMQPVKKNFLVEDYGGAIRVIKQNGFRKCFPAKINQSLENEIDETRRFIEQNKIDLVVIDKYKVNRKFVSSLRKYVSVVVITDLKKKDYSADLLVNGFIGFENKIEKNRFGTRCLLGPKFQIINDFKPRKYSKQKKNFKLLATFGGYDVQNISGILSEQIREHGIKFKTKIIVGPSTDKDLTKKKIKSLKNLEIIKSTTDMFGEISKAEVGICSGGITSYEFALGRIPFAIICQHKHQLLTAREWEKKGICKNLGLVDKNIERKIKKFLKNIEEENFNFKNIKKNTVDRKGSKRVAKEILKIIKN